MKRLAPICLLLIGTMLLMAGYQDATAAPKVKLHVVGKSMNQRPSGSTWAYNPGLLVAGLGSKVYLYADTTGSADTTVTSWTWSVTAGTATLDSGATSVAYNSFTPGATGTYTIQITANATGSSATSSVTVYVSTYTGNTANPMDAPPGCFCHSNGAVTGGVDYFAKWSKTPHATMMKRGMMGQQEVVEETNQGLYAQGCTNCHGVAPEPLVDNGNYAFLAHTQPAASPNSWDSIWVKGLPKTADGRDVMITVGVDTIWNKMPADVKLRATIGCENCHGPAAGHKAGGAASMIAVSAKSDACNACHDGSKRHSLGSWARVSRHQTGHTIEGEGGNSSCAKCHSGQGFIDNVKNGSVSVTPEYAETPIGCPTCHDPHDTTNVDMYQLRKVTVTLSNGFTPPGEKTGYLCMNCHQARSAVTTYVKPNEPAAPNGNKYYGFKSRFYPHHSNQGDMLFGQNGYEYGDTRLSGLQTHANLEGACATCHMAMRPTGSGNEMPNHQWDMDPTRYTAGLNPLYNPGKACESCHGVEDYEQIQAAWDYDGDQVVESAMAEVEGMMTKLKAFLPKNTSGEVIGGGSVNATDSAAVANRLDYVAGIWTYWFVEEDRSMGMHNAKYTVRLLGKALNETWANVEIDRENFGQPETYALSQNYPNPFNPTTNIQFSVAKAGPVRIDIYDMVGQHVSTLLNTTMSSGNYNITWNGDDKTGARVASGMYLYRMIAGNFAMTKKMLMVK